MPVTAFWFVNAFETMLNAETDFLADAINVRLHTVTYVPNQDTHAFGSDLTNELATAGGYTAGGEALGTKTHANTLNVSTLDAANTVWTSSGAGFTARIASVLDVSTAVEATSPLLIWVDFGQNETASGGGTFTIAWAAGGIATITPADATGFP